MWFFFRVSITLAKFTICSATWSIFSLILITVTLKFLLVNFSPWVFCGFVSVGCLCHLDYGSHLPLFLLYFGYTMQLMGCQFPDQRLNQDRIRDIES